MWGEKKDLMLYEVIIIIIITTISYMPLTQLMSFFKEIFILFMWKFPFLELFSDLQSWCFFQKYFI
jgi:hypothetical protein